jgi:hypothetical protein
MSVRMAPKKKNRDRDSPPPLPQARKIPIQYKEILKEFEEKQALIRFRHDAHLRQRNANYRGEYQRLTGHMNALNMGLGAGDMARLQNRRFELARLAQTGLTDVHP